MGHAIAGSDKRWPDATIPFTIHSSVDSDTETLIRQAIDYWEERTQVSFTPRDGEDGFLRFEQVAEREGLSGNASHIGYKDSKITIKLDPDISVGTIIHEIGHVIGLKHEQTRRDRAKYVCVYKCNIPDDQYGDYETAGEGDTIAFEKYDYFSTMHYGQGYASEEVINLNGRAIDIPGVFSSSGYLSRGDVRTSRRILPSNVHVHEMDRVSRIGDKIYDTDMGSGWDKVRVFEVGGEVYLMRYRDSDGLYRIRRFNSDGTLPSSSLYRGNMDTGISSMTFYTDSSGTYCATYNNGTMTLKIFKMNSDGSLGTETDSRTRSQEYTYILSYEVTLDNGSTVRYVMLYDKESGSSYVRVLDLNGDIDDSMPIAWSIGKDYTLFSTFVMDSKTYLFAYKSGTGEANVFAFSTNSYWGPGTVRYLYNRYYWTKSWSSATILESTDGLQLFLLKKTDGTMHVNRLYHYNNIDANGNSQGYEAGIGGVLDERDWSSGWSTARAFYVGSKQLLLLYKKDTGDFQINEVDEHLSIGEETQRYEWSDGWSSVRPYSVGSKNFLFLLKESNGIVHIHELNDDGSVGSMVEEHDWSSGWSKVRFYEVGGNTYMFLLKEGDGTVHVHMMNTDGSVGGKIDEYDWRSGWSSAEFYTVTSVLGTSKTYLFLLKKSGTGSDGNNVHVHEVNDDGTIGDKVWDDNWTEGWTTARFFRSGSGLFLFVLKKTGTGSDGKNVHIHEVNSDGSIGTKVSTESWTEGWSLATFLSVQTGLLPTNYETYMLIIKSSNGTMHFHKMNSDGSVGTKLIEDDWSSGWTHAQYWRGGSRNYLFLSKENGPHTTM